MLPRSPELPKNRIKARPWRLLECPKLCPLSSYQVNQRNSELIHAWYEEGCNNSTIVERAAAVGVVVSERSVANHRQKHIEPLDETAMLDPAEIPVGEDGQVSDIDLLNLLISKGAETLKHRNIKVSPEMALKAMELKYKLTQGSVFQDFMDAFAGVNEELAANEAEAAAAVSEQDEQEQQATSDDVSD